MEKQTDNTQTDDSAPNEAVLTAAKNVIASFLTASKNFALYPEEHASTQRLLSSVKASLDTFFSLEKNLRLDISQASILYSGAVAYKDPVSGDGLAFLFFRDGIKWLEFKHGITTTELAAFFHILHQYKSLQAESEGDLVTAFYQANFSDIAYEASDDFWEAEPLLDFSQLKVDAVARGSGFEEDERILSTDQAHEDLPISIADPSVDRSLWRLNAEEEKSLRAMVNVENKGKTTVNIFDVLFIILNSQKEKGDFALSLDFILEELLDSFSRQQFAEIHDIFQSLTKLYQAKEGRNELTDLIKSFFQKVSAPPVIDAIVASILELRASDDLKLKQARGTLLFLSPSVLGPLSEALVRTKNPAQQKLFLEIIGILAQRNFKAFKELINTSDADKLAKLIILLGYIKGKESDAILMEKIHHPSVSVRQAAIKILLSRDAQTINKLFPLIDDPDESIRQTVFFGIGQQKSNLAESLLLNYTEQKAFKHSSQDHILSCLKALGGCGSEHSHGLLKKILLDQGWNSTFGFGRPVFRKGAAAALLIMDSVEAKNILNKAAQSSFSIVRDALQKAIEEKENAR